MRGLAILSLAVALACGAAAVQSSAQLFEQSVAALSRGDYSAAEAGFKQILQNSPNDLAALQNLGVVYARTGRLDKAIGAYQRVLELDPGSETALLNLSLAYFKRKSNGEALAVFQNLVRVEPEARAVSDIHLLYMLCDGYLKQNQTENGRRTMASFLAGLPPAPASLVRCKLLHARGQLEAADAECRKSVAIDPKLPGVHLQLARVLIDERSPDASKELAEAISERPNGPEDFYDLGVALAQVGRTDEAITNLERAKQLDPGFWGIYFNLGKIWLRTNHAAQAVPALQKASELNPADFAVFYELGRALIATGKTEAAKQAMKRVRELQALDLERDATAMQKR